MDHNEIFKEATIASVLECKNVSSYFHRFMLLAALQPDAMSREASEAFEKMLSVEKDGIVPRVKKLMEDSTSMSLELHRRFSIGSDQEMPLWLASIIDNVTELSIVSSKMDSKFDAEEESRIAKWPKSYRVNRIERNDY